MSHLLGTVVSLLERACAEYFTGGPDAEAGWRAGWIDYDSE